jgi:broad specificity phosphatase PhoE
MKVYFVRHGHADHNEAFDKTQDKKVYRSFDYKYSKLTEKGIAQIKDILLPEKIQRVYSSPIIRCIETTRILVGESRVVYLHDGLMETQGPYPCNWRPDFDSLSRSMKKYNLKDVNVKYEPYTAYYLKNIRETKEDIQQRAMNTLEQIKSECVNLETIMIVTHNDWLESMFERPFMNGEVYCVEY